MMIDAQLQAEREREKQILWRWRWRHIECIVINVQIRATHSSSVRNCTCWSIDENPKWNLKKRTKIELAVGIRLAENIFRFPKITKIAIDFVLRESVKLIRFLIWQFSIDVLMWIPTWYRMVSSSAEVWPVLIKMPFSFQLTIEK